MFDIVISDEQLKTAYGIALCCNLGQRGYGDGTPLMQAYGMLGQIAITDALALPRPKLNGFDGGYDLEIDGRKADIKTMTRKCPPRLEFVNNLMKCQTKYEVDYYIFTSYNTATNYLTVCGVYPKSWVLEQCTLRTKGEEIKRSDGTTFTANEDFYEVPNSQLIGCDSVAKLIEIFRR